MEVEPPIIYSDQTCCHGCEQSSEQQRGCRATTAVAIRLVAATATA